MAIGAPRAQVMKMVLADGLAWVLPGLLAGFLLSLLVTPLLARLLFGVKPGNAENYALIFGVVLLVSALAAFLPARRAMNIDPLTALRYE
jgi:ABC-type antimicrobial peptide transport system permease subunit